MSKAVVAKLSIEVYRQFEAALSTLKSGTGGGGGGAMVVDVNKLINRDFISWLEVQVNLNKALALKLLAIGYYDQQKVGHAVGYSKLAVAAMTDGVNGRFHPQNQFVGRFVGALVEAKEDVEHRARKIKLDNDHVTFQKEVDPKLLEIPDGRSITKPIAWEQMNPSFTDIY